MSMETVKLSEYVNAALAFDKDPTGEKLGEVKKVLNRIQIREYVTLREKQILMIGMLRTLSDDFDAVGSAVALERQKAVAGLLAYCVNVEDDLGEMDLFPTTVDMIYQYGLMDRVLEAAGPDYRRLCGMLDDSIQLSNIYRLIETTQLFDDDYYDKWLKAMDELKTQLDSDSLRELMKATSEADGDGQTLLALLQAGSLAQVKGDAVKEHEKMKRAEEAVSKKGGDA